MSDRGGFQPDNTRRSGSAPLIVSSELHSKGRGAMKDSVTGFQPSDQQFNDAAILGAPLPLATYIMAAPTVRDQLHFECVAFATSYQRSIEQYYSSGASSYSDSTNIFSMKYIYNQCKFDTGDCGGGTSVGTALTLMVQQGCCLYNTMPYDGDCITQPDNTQRTEAALYKISGYSQLYFGDLAALKAQLQNNHPLIWNTSIDDSMINVNGDFLADGYIWSHYSGSGGIPHAMCIIGYDDTKVCPSNGAVGCFRAMNSYGATWADSGFYWVTYDWFLQAAGYYIYVINGSVPSNTAPVANAGFDFTIPAGSTAVLDGSGSYDPDGIITTYAWTKVSGPSSPTINNSSSPVANIVPSVAGTYVYQLAVTDDDSATSTDIVTIVVTAVTVESYVLSVSKVTAKGKVSDKIAWNISLNNPPISAAIEYSVNNTTNFTTLYSIVPYVTLGTYTLSGVQKRATYYFRLKIVKADGTTVYSSTYSIRN